MRSVRLADFLAGCALMALLSGAGGCMEAATPCGSVDAGNPQRAMVSQSHSLLAIAERSGSVTVVRNNCSDGPCQLEQVVRRNVHADQLLLSGDGNWVAYVRDERFNALHVFDPERNMGSSTVVKHLVGTLRSGAFIVYRFRDKYGLRAYDLERHESIILDDDLHLRAVALGDRTLIARTDAPHGGEDLYLVRLNPPYLDPGLEHERGVIHLGHARRIERVVVSRGPTPRALGWEDAQDPDIPIDEYVVVTSPRDDKVWTTVYSAKDGSVIDSFPGKVASGHDPLSELAGVSAVAPDGRHLAYVGRDGSLSLRDLKTSASCQLRSPVGTEHRVAGFAGDGTLYFQSRDDDPDTGVVDRVFAYDLQVRDLALLSEPNADQALSAAPMLRAEAMSARDPRPWAITAGYGFNAAYGGDETQSLRELTPTKTTFIPRDDPYMWALEASAREDDDQTVITLRRVQPRLDADDSESMRFEQTRPMVVPISEREDDPRVPVGPAEPFEFEFNSDASVCVSISRVGEWLSQCTSPTNVAPFIPGELPGSET